MQKRAVWAFLQGMLLLLFFLPASAQEGVIDAAVVRGSLGGHSPRHLLTVSAWNPAKPLTLLLEYTPQGQWELDDRSGFFVFDPAGFERFRNGELPGAVSVAAGDRLPGAGRRLQATIGPPVSGTFTVVVYNDSPIPMGYTLRAVNGGISGGGQVIGGGAPAPAGGGDAGVYPLVIVPPPTPIPTPIPTPVPPLRASALRGWLDARYAQDFFRLEVIDPKQPLSVEMTYDPAEQIHLIDSFNFWIFDDEQFRTQDISGARPELEPNRAAGRLFYREDIPFWEARIDQPLDHYWLVVNQHVHALSVGYRLVVQNGVLVDDGQQAQSLLAEPRLPPGVGYTLWIVRPGDSAAGIAQAVYGDRRYAGAICVRNGIPNCNRLSIGQRLLLPPVAQLPALLPSGPARSPSAAGPQPARPGAGGGPVAGNLLDVAAWEANLQAFRDLLGPTALGERLRGPGPYTLFAFTNAAFDGLAVEDQDALLVDEEAAGALLAGHVAAGLLSPGWITRPKQVASLSGSLLRVEPDGVGGFRVNGAPVVGGPLEAANGVIYLVDGVLGRQTTGD